MINPRQRQLIDLLKLSFNCHTVGLTLIITMGENHLLTVVVKESNQGNEFEGTWHFRMDEERLHPELQSLINVVERMLNPDTHTVYGFLMTLHESIFNETEVTNG